MATVREVRRLVCNACDTEVYKCSLCGEYFEKDQKIQCSDISDRHKCMECC